MPDQEEDPENHEEEEHEEEEVAPKVPDEVSDDPSRLTEGSRWSVITRLEQLADKLEILIAGATQKKTKAKKAKSAKLKVRDQFLRALGKKKKKPAKRGSK